MLSLSKHLYRFVATALISIEVEMLRYALHDVQRSKRPLVLPFMISSTSATITRFTSP